MDTTIESYGFKAEIQQLLHILAHSLYKDREIFLRELISNASDALTRLQFESLTNKEILNPDIELAIYIDVVEEEGAKRLLIKDTGIGMTHDEIVANLGTIAQSGAREFMARLSKGDVEAGEVIGQFGVGFYSVFMVADSVRVVSRSYRSDAEAVTWVSDGGDKFTVEPATKEERGTEIHITLKQDAQELANDWRLKQIVKKYSDYVRFPIYVGGERANRSESLWRKPPTETTADETKEFYRQMSMDFEEPLLTIHFSSDAPVHIRGLLFIPRQRDRGMLATRKEPGLMLYSQNVLIQEYCKDLLPPWLGFVDGVVDSEDLPLNVSRETVQNSRLMQQLGKSVKSRVLRELKKLGESDEEKYGQFFEVYGQVLKEGLAIDPSAREEILPLLRYKSSRSNGDWLSLDDYIKRMPDGQEEIYYVISDSVQAAARSPHLDAFNVRNLEVLFWHDPLDVFLAPMLDQYREKKFHNVADADITLPAEEGATETDGEDSPVSEPALNLFIGKCVTTLGQRVSEVRISRVLKDNPVRLVSPGGQDAELQRIYRMMGREYEAPQFIFEINSLHPLIVGLAKLISNQPDSPLVIPAIEQLYAGALMQEGLHPNPVEMLPRIQDVMQFAVDTLNKTGSSS